MIETKLQPLPHGIDLSIRCCGRASDPTLLFLHGFPEAAFIWDDYLVHFAAKGYRTIAPNLRGFERSSSPAQVNQYRAKFLLQDLIALIEQALGTQGTLAALIAHDWGGALAWGLANQRPDLMQKLLIINSPHPATLLRELQNSPEQYEASLYMNFLARPDAPALLAENDFARLWPFLTSAQSHWLTEDVKNQYRSLWRQGLHGGCNYYAASPLKPDANIHQLTLPSQMFNIEVPTRILWGMQDRALRPALLEGLEKYIADLSIRRIADASHWITHEQPVLVQQWMTESLQT